MKEEKKESKKESKNEWKATCGITVLKPLLSQQST